MRGNFFIQRLGERISIGDLLKRGRSGAGLEHRLIKKQINLSGRY
jgi:hypothetical protein